MLNHILITNKNITYLLKKATKTWGIESQLRLLQEECGECVAAVNRFFRGRENARENLASEVADVLLMALQIRSILGNTIVDEEIENKLRRLNQRLEDSERQ